MPSDPIADLYIGEVLGGRYKVVEFINSGGFCLVFRAEDIHQGTGVAVKILKPGVDGDAAIEFDTEGILLDRLRKSSRVLTLVGDIANSDTITVHKSGIPTPIPLPVRYLVLELADACLADLVVERQSIRWLERLSLFRDVVLGVHQMHLQHLVHRDMKSENVLVALEPSGSATALVADLGRGRDTQAPRRFLSDDYLAGRGDLRFAPPELLCLLGSDDPTSFRRADLFLLGSVLFELATGQGVTSIAYGNPHAVLDEAIKIEPSERATEYRSRLTDIRARFEPAFLLASREFSSAIRYDATRLLRQLCDPDPTARETRHRAESRNPTWGLQWLLRRTDILLKREFMSVKKPHHFTRKVS